MSVIRNEGKNEKQNYLINDMIIQYSLVGRLSNVVIKAVLIRYHIFVANR